MQVFCYTELFTKSVDEDVDKCAKYPQTLIILNVSKLALKFL